jgi:hypothetical protein
MFNNFGSNYNMPASAPLSNYHASASIGIIQPMSHFNGSASIGNLQPSSSAQFSNYRPSASAVTPHSTATSTPLCPYQNSAASLPFAFGQTYNGKVPLNRDPNPLEVRKKSNPISYIQQVGVRFIKPEPLPPHIDILVKHLPDTQLPPSPPLYMRNNPPPPLEQPVQIIREQPPLVMRNIFFSKIKLLA